MEHYRWILVPLLVGLVACGGSHESQTPADQQVIVRDNTRVLDSGGRELLASYDGASGMLVFSATTPQLEALAPGDLLVSEPTAAAPYGFLRKVSSVTPQGGGLVVQSIQGSLREAIVQGSLTADGTLAPSDLSLRLVPGSAVQALSSGLHFDVPVDVLLKDVDGNLSTTGDQARLQGDVGFGLGYHIEMGFKASYDPPFDVDVSTKLIATLTFDENAGLTLVTSGAVTLYEELPLGTYNFAPITFFVGPIPVVLVPSVKVSAVGNGNAGAKTSFGAQESLTVEAGVHKDYGEGFKPVFDVTPTGSAQGPTLTPELAAPSFNLRGGIRARGSLRLYDLVGPYADFTTWANDFAGIGHKPPWRILGGVGATVGVEADLLFWEYDWSHDILDQSWTLGEATGNTAPIISSIEPKQGTSVQLGQPVTLGAVAGDVEDGWFCCTRVWSSDKEGALGADTSFGLKHVFQAAGTHHLTVTVTDSGGAQVSGSTTIEVVNTPPVVSLTKPTPNFTWYRGVPLLLQGWATDGNQSCDSLGLTWSSSSGDSMPAASCTAPVKVAFPSNGARTLTLTAVDDQLASDSKSVAISIVDPPGNIPPDVAILEPAPGAAIADYQSVTLRAQVYDPDNATVTYSWSVSNSLGTKQVAQGTVPGDASAGTSFNVSVAATGNLLCSGNATNTLELRVADGTGGHLVSSSVAVTCAIVPK
jgi:hypothetical protein